MSFYRNTTFNLRMNSLLPSLPPNPRLTIHFEFLFKTTYEPPTFLNRYGPLCYRSSAHVAAGKSLQYDSIREAVRKAYIFLPSDDERQRLSDFVWEEVRKSFPTGGVLPECAVLSLCFDVRSVNRLVPPVESDESGMVPAADSSLRLLEKFDGDVEEERCCTICLEEIGGGGGALRTPCAHVFQGGCIKEWLRKSHYCPTCSPRNRKREGEIFIITYTLWSILCLIIKIC